MSDETVTKNDGAALLCAEELHFAYQPKAPILKGISMCARRHELLGILGVNGAGKSTLLYCLDNVLRPSRGRVLVKNEDISLLSRNHLARKVALVAQRTAMSQLSVFDFVLLGRRPYMGLTASADDLDLVAATLERLALEAYPLRYVNELSGGEFQKVVLARALVQQTEILLLDEPTNNLDPFNQVEVMRIVRQVVDQEQIAAVAVMHDLNLALRFCDQLLFLADGLVYAHIPVSEVDSGLIRAVYGLEADVIDHRGRRVVIA